VLLLRGQGRHHRYVATGAEGVRAPLSNTKTRQCRITGFLYQKHFCKYMLESQHALGDQSLGRFPRMAAKQRHARTYRFAASFSSLRNLSDSFSLPDCSKLVPHRLVPILRPFPPPWGTKARPERVCQLRSTRPHSATQRRPLPPHPHARPVLKHRQAPSPSRRMRPGARGNPPDPTSSRRLQHLEKRKGSDTRGQNTVGQEVGYVQLKT
jgi:hypothetical protein